MTDKLPPKSSPELWAKLKPLARQMRHNPTPAEKLLWQKIRKKALGVKFRRQHSIDRFIVDFYCHELILAIEVDGTIHEYTEEEDAFRQLFLEEIYGVTFLRFTNGEVMKQIDAVLTVIGAKIYDLQNPSH